MDAIEAADLDGDGAADIAGTDEIGGMLRVAYLGDGFTVKSEQLLAAGKRPRTPVIARLTGGAHPDIVVPCIGSSEVAVFPWKDGAYAEAVLVTSIRAAAAVSMGDLDGDGLLDAAVAGRGGIAVHLRRLEGGLGAARSFATDASHDHASIAVADWNGDGKLDVLTAAKSLDSIFVFLGKGKGDLEAATSFEAGHEPTSIDVRDVNVDGIPDVVTSSSTGHGVGLVLGEPGGGHEEPAVYLAGNAGTGLRVADVDGDGVLDAVTRGDGIALLLLGRRAPAGTAFRRGDADSDGRAAITDAVVLLDWLFRGGAALGCEDAADADDDGALGLTDAVYLLRWLFQGGAELPAPGPLDCGADPTEDGLGGCGRGC